MGALRNPTPPALRPAVASGGRVRAVDARTGGRGSPCRCDGINRFEADSERIIVRVKFNISIEVIKLPTCENCGAFVTPGFVRVFGSNDREVFGCTECTSLRVLKSGRGARPEP